MIDARTAAFCAQLTSGFAGLTPAARRGARRARSSGSAVRDRRRRSGGPIGFRQDQAEWFARFFHAAIDAWRLSAAVARTKSVSSRWRTTPRRSRTAARR